MLNSILELVYDSGFCYVDWRMVVMWAVSAVLLYLAVFRQYEPLLLVPIAFGALLANLPTEGVVNKPAGYLVSPAEGIVKAVFVQKGDEAFAPRVIKHLPTKVSEIVRSEQTAQKDIADFFAKLDDVSSPEGRKDVFKRAEGLPDMLAIVSPLKFEAKKDIERALAGKVFNVSFKGKPLALKADEHFVWLANGKRRTLANPKRKNKKHVQQTATVIALISWTDKRLRTWLNEFAAAQ